MVGRSSSMTVCIWYSWATWNMLSIIRWEYGRTKKRKLQYEINLNPYMSHLVDGRFACTTEEPYTRWGGWNTCSFCSEKRNLKNTVFLYLFDHFSENGRSTEKQLAVNIQVLSAIAQAEDLQIFLPKGALCRGDEVLHPHIVSPHMEADELEATHRAVVSSVFPDEVNWHSTTLV